MKTGLEKDGRGACLNQNPNRRAEADPRETQDGAGQHLPGTHNALNFKGNKTEIYMCLSQ